MVDLDFFTVSDPQCTLKVRESGVKYATWTMNGATEVIDNNLNPKWIKHFNVHFIFNRDVDMLFQVWNYNSEDSKDLIGEAEVSLSKVMTSKGQSMLLQLQLCSLLRLVGKPG